MELIQPGDIVDTAGGPHAVIWCGHREVDVSRLPDPDPHWLVRIRAGAFADATLTAIESANPTNPGVQPRPTIGIQFVDIPEFTDLGTKVSNDISAVIAGKETVANALNTGQKLAQAVGDKYKNK